MRRGLIARSTVELPDTVFTARLERVRAAMQADGLDALLIYTNNTRPAGVSWLAGFVPYWSEAVLVVPLAGEPYLVAALSFRVKTWIERVSRLADVLREGGPRLTLRDASALFATLRAVADPAEVALAGKAASIARQALVAMRGENLNAMIGSVEMQARS